MPLSSPRLDDRNYKDLLNDAINHLKSKKSEWKGDDPSDPGVILLELFSFLTEELLYRLNRLPEKTHVELLRLIGAMQRPPSAAHAMLRFYLDTPPDEDLIIPAHTEVTVPDAGEKDPVFLTFEQCIIKAGTVEAEVLAFDCVYHEAERVEDGNGQPGFTATVAHAPIVTDALGKLKTTVAVEQEIIDDPDRKLTIGNKTYRKWTEFSDIADLDWDHKRFYVEKHDGCIRFPLQFHDSLCDVKEVHRGIHHFDKEIRVWYHGGGGKKGNVDAGRLTVIKNAGNGNLKVVNDKPATGGGDAETMEQLLRRGPSLIYRADRAITAGDFEHIAENNSGISKAYAAAKAELWPHAQPGVVAVYLLPRITINDDDLIKKSVPNAIHDLYVAAQNDAVKIRIGEELEKRKPLGIGCEVHWARLEAISITARVLIHPNRNIVSTQMEILNRLYREIDPDDGVAADADRHRTTISVSLLYNIIMGVAGAMYVKDLFFEVLSAPDKNVTDIAADPFTPNTWYACSGTSQFRSINNGRDWHMLKTFDNENLKKIRISGLNHGHMAICSDKCDNDNVFEKSTIHFTLNNGESWDCWNFDTPVNDCAWAEHEGKTFIYIAGDAGLFRLDAGEKSSPRKISVEEGAGHGFYTVSSTRDKSGNMVIAAAAMNRQGVFISYTGLSSVKFTSVGIINKDIRAMTFERVDSRTFLWLGVTVPGEVRGDGCIRIEIDGDNGIIESTQFKEGWNGGSCRDIKVINGHVYAGTHRRGLATLDNPDTDHPRWQLSPITCGLPILDAQRLFEPINAVAAANAVDSTGVTYTLLLAGTDNGIFRRKKDGSFYRCSSARKYDKITIPKSWFFCSGKHIVTLEEYHEEG